ncbi:helix-turn-helix domain-containing protein [Paenibacillus sp. BC26]|uniref:helix-turn-helix domain-containing protein n=1 Tax=Paenibacillus sp. BC26 TaxID=1881032 RepID=UPI0015A5FC31|nr:AraC family transcriptional regulator [Paenibacillus sp. BC26]
MNSTQLDLVPYIRSASNAIRKPFILGERTLLDYAILYVQEGTMRVTLTREKKVYTITNGQFCMLQPGDLHILEGTTDTISPYVHMDLFYNPHRERSFVTMPGQIQLAGQEELMQPRISELEGFKQVPFLFTPKNKSAFVETMLALIEAWNDGACGLHNRMKAHGAALQLIFQLLEPYVEEERAPNKSHSLLGWVTSYFALHISEPLRVADMAKRANLSVPRFNVVFRETFGVSPYHYFLTLRLKHAKELLRTSMLTMHEIADYCGFTDNHHFANTFKRTTGLTPGQYRAGMNESE